MRDACKLLSKLSARAGNYFSDIWPHQNLKMWVQIVSHMETVEIIFVVAYKLYLINQVSSLVVIVSFNW